MYIGELDANSLRSHIQIVGDPFRIARESKFARWSGTGAVAISSGEGDSRPVKHRLVFRGNRRIYSALYIASVTQHRDLDDARVYLDRKLGEGKTRREARHRWWRGSDRHPLLGIHRTGWVDPRALRSGAGHDRRLTRAGKPTAELGADTVQLEVSAARTVRPIPDGSAPLCDPFLTA